MIDLLVDSFGPAVVVAGGNSGEMGPASPGDTGRPIETGHRRAGANILSA